MAQWGVSQQLTFVSKDNNSQLSSSVVKKEEEQDDGEAVKSESLVIPEIRKRKRLTLSQLREARAAGRAKQRQSSNFRTCKQKKLHNSIERWSVERYNLAEKNMLEIMKAEGALFNNPISRPELRIAARKCIADTGLLDHLLKHIDGKVAPGGAERFRRCYNTSGVMEYWLESADLVKIRHEAGVLDPNWIPPSWWKPGGGTFQDSAASTEELKLLKAEMDKMKRDMQELISKQRKQDQCSPIEEMHQELVKWKAKTDERLMEVSTSLSGMQDMYRELIEWKAKSERQLIEISNSLSSMQASKQCTTFSPSAPERWEDWLESTNLDNIQGEDLAPWLESTVLVNVGQDATVQDPYSAPPPQSQPGDSPSQELICARDLELLKEEMVKMKRDVQELVPRRQEEDQATVTPDSSTTANSKLDVDNSLLLFQEMFKELVKWKAKVEQHMMEISNSVSALQASQPFTGDFNF